MTWTIREHKSINREFMVIEIVEEEEERILLYVEKVENAIEGEEKEK